MMFCGEFLMLHDGSTMVLKDVDKHTEGVSQEVNFNILKQFLNILMASEAINHPLGGEKNFTVKVSHLE